MSTQMSQSLIIPQPSQIFILLLRGSSGSPSNFHTHFQEFIASKPQKIMT